ncbi:R3H and coiled-coil domain-containing protein 1 [Blyttiomyces sp. JEL0837]|nr:R3H and coiled-coil domain-containing protein 1 [Blyttiomyces sp. JEL0837]
MELWQPHQLLQNLMEMERQRARPERPNPLHPHRVHQIESPTDGGVRRGRGNFRAPITSTSNKQHDHQERGQHAQTVRVYPKEFSPPSSKKPVSGSLVEPDSTISGTNKSNGNGNSNSLSWRSGPSLSDQNAKALDQEESLVKSVETLNIKPAEETTNPTNGDNNAIGDEVEEWETLGDESLPIPPKENSTKPKSAWSSTGTSSIPPWESTGSTRVLECYDFSPSFKTEDLVGILTDTTSSGGNDFRIKWINDTSALFIFQNEASAKKSYARAVTSPFVKVRPFEGPVPTDSSRPELSVRPVKTDVVARRMIAGALGVRARKKTASEEEEDKKKIKDALYQRLAEKQSKQQREAELQAAWDE